HGVDLQQVLGHVLDHLARASARARPVRSAEAVKRRSTLAAEVLLHTVQVFDGLEEAIAFCVLELEAFAMRAILLDQAHALAARSSRPPRPAAPAAARPARSRTRSPPSRSSRPARPERAAGRPAVRSQTSRGRSRRPILPPR